MNGKSIINKEDRMISKIIFNDGTVKNITDDDSFLLSFNFAKNNRLDGLDSFTVVNIANENIKRFMLNTVAIIQFSLMESNSNKEFIENFASCMNSYKKIDELTAKGQVVYKSTCDILKRKREDGTLTDEEENRISEKMINDMRM